MDEIVEDSAGAGVGEGQAADDAAAGADAKRFDSAATLRTVVEMVRRVMRADTAGVASFSLDERTITWKAMSGFRSVAAEGERDLALVPLSARGETLGVLAVGFRSSHRFAADEKQLLEDLAEMAALALDN